MKLSRAAVMVVVSVTLTGLMTACGSGEPADPDPPELTEAFDPAALDIGRIEPTGTDVSSGLTYENSVISASYELASHLVQPQMIDSDLVMYGIESGPLIGQDQYEFALSEAAPAMSGAEAGMVSRRQDTASDGWITTALLQFPDDATAAAAAEGAAALLVAPDEDGYNKLVAEDVATDPQAYGVATTTPDVANQVYVLRAYDRYVAYAWVYDTRGTMSNVRQAAEDFLLEQELALEGITPVRVPAEPRVRDLDPTGVWSLALAPDSRGTVGTHAYNANATAALTNMINVDGLGRAFKQAGVSRVASNLTTIYATKGDTQAANLVRTLADFASDLGMADAEAPVGLEGARCLAKEDEDNSQLSFWPPFICFHAFDAYLLEAQGVSITEAQQRLSAQALLIHEANSDQKRSSSGG